LDQAFLQVPTSNIITAVANKIKHKPKGINVVIVVNKVHREGAQ